MSGLFGVAMDLLLLVVVGCWEGVVGYQQVVEEETVAPFWLPVTPWVLGVMGPSRGNAPSTAEESGAACGKGATAPLIVIIVVG